MNANQFLEMPSELAFFVETEMAKLDPQLLILAPKSLPRLIALSPYAANIFQHYPAIFARILEQKTFQIKLKPEQLSLQLQDALHKCGDEITALKTLRLLRHEWLIGVIWRDLCRQESGIQNAWETSQAISEIAEVFLQETLIWLENFYAPRWGRARSSQEGKFPQQMIVLGMGKLGASELNLSSDIDLIFAYTEEGYTQGGKRSLTNQAYFTKLSQKLIYFLNQLTSEGFVFRVDMRLRPLGEGSPIINTVAATLKYYTQQGRDWERFALVKMRAVAGDLEAGKALIKQLSSFVYRRYIDYSIKSALRDIHQQINQQTQSEFNNIKLGIGGIREIEFLVVNQQIIHGGQEVILQTPSLQKAFNALIKLKYIKPDIAELLIHHYLSLRDIEHALQAAHNQQTHCLPQTAIEQARLAYAMLEVDYQTFSEALLILRQTNHRIFIDYVKSNAADTDKSEKTTEKFYESEDMFRNAIIKNFINADVPITDALEKGISDLLALKNKSQQEVAKNRLQTVLPILMKAFCDVYRESVPRDLLQTDFVSRAAPLVETITRVHKVLNAVMRRSVYLTLLTENEMACYQLVRFCALSQWVSDQLTAFPGLLNALTSEIPLFSLLDENALHHELNRKLNTHSIEDQEKRLEILSYFKQEKIFQIALADLDQKLPLMKVSDALTSLAELIIGKTFELVQSEKSFLNVRKKFPLNDFEFMVIGYGKLGSFEMAYESDLDLVFVYREMKKTEKSKTEIEPAVFFNRIGQKMIHLLTTKTSSGILYEVDTRLRPSGNSGLLVTSFQAYCQYQQKSAWLWEHQALVKARPIYGHEALKKDFTQLRQQILQKERNKDEVIEEIANMRKRIASTKNINTNHDKWRTGGLIDIEFLCQFIVLTYSHLFTEISIYTDNIRILSESEKKGILKKSDSDKIIEIYIQTREKIHQRQLGQINLINPEKLKEGTQFIQCLWTKYLNTFSR